MLVMLVPPSLKANSSERDPLPARGVYRNLVFVHFLFRSMKVLRVAFKLWNLLLQ
jgi:hypothetical protein